MSVILVQDIDNAFLKVKSHFPFKDYMRNSKLPKYRMIILRIIENCPEGSTILSIGSGPCDLESILCNLGYNVTAIDDLQDHWHVIGKNQDRIQKFAKDMNVALTTEKIDIANIEFKQYDLVLLIDFIEHIHGSPKDLLNFALSVLKSNGLILIEVPNAVNLKNRIKVLFGKSNQQSIGFIFWNIGEYRSHFREYTKAELIEIMKNMNIKNINVTPLNIRTRMHYWSSEKKIKKIFILIYGIISEIFPNFRDTLIATGKKPEDWQPIQDSIQQFKKYYDLVEKNNLDGLSDNELLTQISKKGV